MGVASCDDRKGVFAWNWCRGSFESHTAVGARHLVGGFFFIFLDGLFFLCFLLDGKDAWR